MCDRYFFRRLSCRLLVKLQQQHIKIFFFRERDITKSKVVEGVADYVGTVEYKFLVRFSG